MKTGERPVAAFMRWKVRAHRATCPRRQQTASGWRAMFLSLLAAMASTPAAAGPLRCVLVAEDSTHGTVLDSLKSALTRDFGFVWQQGGAAGPASTAGGLRDADVAIVYRGPGALDAGGAAHWREFLGAGKGLVLIAGVPGAWPTEPRFAVEVLGATPAGTFANGAPLAVINLYPHPIFTGITRFETDEPIPQYVKLADDAQMIMEGTVGEATAPLAWLRRGPGGSLAHFVFGNPGQLSSPAFQRLLGQAALWTARRPIPGAQATVQRTFMPEAYPGAFAITLPNGPGLCLDPVRGGINYVWAGDFVDLRPRWLTKQGEPARFFGPVFYREKEWHPLRAGSPQAGPDVEFLGYSLESGFPEFHYRIGGRDVHESFRAGEGENTLVRRFRVGAGAASLWLALEPQGEADVVVRGLSRDGNTASYTSTQAGEFTIEIRPKAAVKP